MHAKIQFHRAQSGYYFTTKPIIFEGRTSHAVIEESDGGTFWRLRIESFPGMVTVHQTKRHAIFALEQMVAGQYDLVLQ